ncbi:MAG: MEKHLA domain-containing protein [Cyanobacteria bacterium P01_G01_bin.39]
MNNHNHASSDRLSSTLNLAIWQQPEVIRWSQIMADSYFKLLGKELINLDNTPEKLAQALFKAPFVLVSHDTQYDPIFNYANQTALQLWSLTWSEFTQTPSAATTEPVQRSDRQIMLRQAQEQGYIDNYQGVRIANNGKKFLIQEVTLWNLTDESGQRCGQAATFPNWTWL